MIYCGENQCGGRKVRIFFICKVRGVTEDSAEYAIQKQMVEEWEREGHHVHWPPRDHLQRDPERGTGICRAIVWAIFRAHEVRVRFDPTSEGWLADVMMTFALNELGKIFPNIIGRRRVVILNPEAVERKIQEETARQLADGIIDPHYVKSYTMVLKNLADEAV